jgi:alpha-galactosidase
VVLDPTVPENLERIGGDIRLFRRWGYELIKHDFSTWDLAGRWGFQMGDSITEDGWSFEDRSKTNAEILKDIYKAVSDAAEGAVIIGCNTVGHLIAGYAHIQRTGDDTSGREWSRTRKMGINTLAFRACQNRMFFALDADCVGITEHIPWRLNAQWLDLLAKSGTPLFVSAMREAIGPSQKKALKAAFSTASAQLPTAEPLDWMDTSCPRKWKLAGDKVEFNWSE